MRFCIKEQIELAGQEEDGELMWMGNNEQWKAMRNEVKDYEKEL